MFRWELNWASLYYVSQLVLVLSICAGVLYVGLMALLIGVGDACTSYDNKVTRWLNRRHVTPRARRHVNRLLPSTTLLVVGYILGAAGIFSPIRELHNVEVMGKLSNRVYDVIVPARGNPPATVDRRETFRLCPEGDDLPLVPGMVIEPLQYIQGVDCLLITRDTYVDWKRDSQQNVVDKNGRLLFAKGATDVSHTK